ncbi:MAG TPA: hypothetical protein VFM18_05380, partial [Methanosarcina sp.]|nr:hypothetical protein [Methanosarcina sp.]
MIIISHRGHWLATEEKNTALAFRRSFLSGFGTETDVRDHLGKLVISHDVVPPDANPLLLDDFLEIYGNFDQPLAINIKSDGLAEILNSTMNRHGITNWFVFDMSIPDMR